jgi:hypothetical protein
MQNLSYWKIVVETTVEIETPKGIKTKDIKEEYLVKAPDSIGAERLLMKSLPSLNEYSVRSMSKTNILDVFTPE